MIQNIGGISTCARYAFAPNYFHYCGPEKQHDLQKYIETTSINRGLTEILHQFETLYPYLILIASSNHIQDPFDPRIVEAYWIGNTYIRNVKMASFGAYLTDTLNVKKRLPKLRASKIIEKAVSGLPHHTSHVLNLFVRTGHHSITHTLFTMDSCRISWGRVEERIGGRGQGTVNTYLVKVKPLTHENGKLQLGKPEIRTVTSIAIQPEKGQWVSLHWGYICEILTAQALQNLIYFTRIALEYANKQDISELIT